MTMTAFVDPQALRSAWSTLLADEPTLRIRDAAARLGVSEAELLATGVGTSVRQISADVGILLPAIESLGDVMALTRNDFFVHEKRGVYRNVSIGRHAAQVVDDEIDLRIFPAVWRFGFAVETEARGEIRRSLQFFDAHGVAVHKIHLKETSDVGAYEALVDMLLLDEQSSRIEVEPGIEPPVDRPDEEVEVGALVDEWKGMADTHDFFHLLRTHRVGRVQALRLVPDELARSVENDALRRVLHSAAAESVPVMVFVRSAGTFQIHHGPVQRVVEARGWLNVLDPRFNLHVREEGIAQSWIVRKPTETGWVTSLELYDSEGVLLALLFGERAEGEPERPEWQALLRREAVRRPESQGNSDRPVEQ